MAQRRRRHQRALADRLGGRRERQRGAAGGLAAADALRRLARRLLPLRAAGRLRRVAIRTSAVRDGDEYVVNGTKQWISNGSCADYYILFARTSDDAKRGLSAFVVPADTAGMSFGAPEKKMGLACDVTTQVLFEAPGSRPRS